MTKARNSGYQVVYVLYRGMGGMPIQSGKLYSLASWRDLKEASDYIYSKYVEPVPDRKMYLYGVSLGGSVAT